jgi:hypothetical protein
MALDIEDYVLIGTIVLPADTLSDRDWSEVRHHGSHPDAACECVIQRQELLRGQPS